MQRSYFDGDAVHGVTLKRARRLPRRIEEDKDPADTNAAAGQATAASATRFAARRPAPDVSRSFGSSDLGIFDVHAWGRAAWLNFRRR
ncbi:MAG: hypothetical protein ACJ731_02590 [Vicinamibacterales bacterium]